MSVWLFALAAILIVLGGIYFNFTPLDAAPSRCPNCRGKTRYHDPFLMCDACEMLVGGVSRQYGVTFDWRGARVNVNSRAGPGPDQCPAPETTDILSKTCATNGAGAN
jgi:hypothetical protein